MAQGSGLILINERRGMVLVSIVVSMLLHLVAAAVLFTVKIPGLGTNPKPAAMSDEALVPIEQPEELRLGLNEATSASINWLGINEPEPELGEARVSETDQAAQALVVGQGEEAAEEAAEEVLAEEPAELIEEIVQEMVPPIEELVEEQIEERIEELVETIQPELVVEKLVEASADPIVFVQPEPIKESVETKTEEQPIQPEQVAKPAQVVVQPEVKPDVKPVEPKNPQGTVGVLSKREAIATRIKRAIEVDPTKPNAPIVGKGLEIKTVHPRYPTAVRLSALPNNPVVIIRFDASGKVSKAEFLRDGRKLYSSGVPGVDQPLLSAIYQWRAKGKEIDKLDPNDPTSLVEITIKIVYQKERKTSSD